MFAFKKYDAKDPVNLWFKKNKGHEIVDEAWDPLYDSEYLYKAMDGCGKCTQSANCIVDICARHLS